jgi:hypothetical protein
VRTSRLLLAEPNPTLFLAEILTKYVVLVVSPLRVSVVLDEGFLTTVFQV